MSIRSCIKIFALGFLLITSPAHAFWGNGAGSSAQNSYTSQIIAGFIGALIGGLVARRWYRYSNNLLIVIQSQKETIRDQKATIARLTKQNTQVAQAIWAQRHTWDE